MIFERPKAVKGSEGDVKATLGKGEKLGPARLVNGKMVHGKGKLAAGKQITLGAMMAKKATPAVSAESFGGIRTDPSRVKRVLQSQSLTKLSVLGEFTLALLAEYQKYKRFW